MSNDTSPKRKRGIPISLACASGWCQTASQRAAPRAVIPLQGPAFAVLDLEEIGRFLAVSHLEAGAVPFELLAETHSDVAEQDRLGQHGGEVEVRVRLRSTVDAGDPFGLHPVVVPLVARVLL